MPLPSDNDDEEKKLNNETSSNSGSQNISGKGFIAATFNAEGNAQVNISQVNYNQLSEVEEERERQKAELDVLQKAIKQKYEDVLKRANTPLPALGNPFLFLQPFGFTDRARFFGRDIELAELSERVTQNAITFLSGNRGAGKTSLLKAGVIPLLRALGHLPLMVTVNSEKLEANIKKELLPNLGGMQLMQNMPLTEFIRVVTSALPEDNLLMIIVDDFEEFFGKAHDETERDGFFNEWQRCFNGATPKAHWLFCVPSDQQHLLKYFKREVQPNSNTISVPPFDRPNAREAILEPALARGITVDEEVVRSILETLGGQSQNIDPADLQLVCYMLAGSKGGLVKHWTMAYYTELGRADGILRDYLDRAIEELEPKEREPAWQVLAVLADPTIETSTEEQLIEKMKPYGVEESTTRRVLSDLQNSNLIEHAAAFKLMSDTLRPRIEKWKETRSARERAREEAYEQLKSIRNSALRGLVGGAIGFLLADLLLFTEPYPDLSYTIFARLLAASFGIPAGLLLVFSIDVSLISFIGPKKPLALLTSGVSGAIAFALVMVMYSNLNNTGINTLISLILKSIIEGGLWGFVAGAGIAWVLSSRRPIWITASITVLLFGLTLSLADIVFGILSKANGLDTTPLTVALAGMIFPGFILAAAMAGQRKNRS